MQKKKSSCHCETSKEQWQSPASNARHTTYPLRFASPLHLPILRPYSKVPKHFINCDYHTERPRLQMALILKLLKVIPYLAMHQGSNGHPLPVSLRLTKLPQRHPFLLVRRKVMYQCLSLLTCLFQNTQLRPIVFLKLEPILPPELLLFL